MQALVGAQRTRLDCDHRVDERADYQPGCAQSAIDPGQLCSRLIFGFFLLLSLLNRGNATGILQLV